MQIKFGSSFILQSVSQPHRSCILSHSSFPGSFEMIEDVCLILKWWDSVFNCWGAGAKALR